MINVAPKRIEELLEVITHCEYHPTDSSTFLFSSSKGFFDICDMRVNSNEKSFATRFNSVDEEGASNYFSDIVNSVCHASFSKSTTAPGCY